MRDMYVLGLESTCDETAASIVVSGKTILSNVVFSQASLHASYGGVYPEIASRAHIEALIPVIEAALKEAGLRKDQIDLIAVAKEPGLVGGLLLGVEVAKGLSLALAKPFIGVNHLEAHLYAAMMNEGPFHFPALGVVLSGGHTLLYKIDSIGAYTRLSTTLDDALGEAFDKLAVMLGYPYPGGPIIEKLAQEGDPHRFKLKAGHSKTHPLDFSYSGLKTALRMLIEQSKDESEKFKRDIAASFQKTVFEDLEAKIRQVCQTHDLHTLYLGGGVICNGALRLHLKSKFLDKQLCFAPKALCVDNAAMIAGLGFHRYELQKHSDPLELTPKTRASLLV